MNQEEKVLQTLNSIPTCKHPASPGFPQRKPCHRPGWEWGCQYLIFKTIMMDEFFIFQVQGLGEVFGILWGFVQTWHASYCFFQSVFNLGRTLSQASPCGVREGNRTPGCCSAFSFLLAQVIRRKDQKKASVEGQEAEI